jgi:hypothetical protein
MSSSADGGAPPATAARGPRANRSSGATECFALGSQLRWTSLPRGTRSL